MRRTALLPIAAALACGSNTPEILEGTWRMSSYQCAGSVTTHASTEEWRVEYKEYKFLTFSYKSPTCPKYEATGVYARDGLDVTEKVTLQDCGDGCIMNVAGNLEACTGQDNTPLTRTYRLTFSDTELLEHARLTPAQFCGEDGIETHYYSRE
jgi:hypothetical protein